MGIHFILYICTKCHFNKRFSLIWLFKEKIFMVSQVDCLLFLKIQNIFGEYTKYRGHSLWNSVLDADILHVFFFFFVKRVSKFYKFIKLVPININEFPECIIYPVVMVTVANPCFCQPSLLLGCKCTDWST